MHERARMKSEHYAEIAAVVFAAEGAFAVIHRVTGGEYPHFEHVHNVAIDIALAAVWFAAAVAMLFRKSFPVLFLAGTAIAVSLMHGLMMSVAFPGTAYGVPFMAAMVVLAMLLKRSLPAWDTARSGERAARVGSPRLRFRHQP